MRNCGLPGAKPGRSNGREKGEAKAGYPIGQQYLAVEELPAFGEQHANGKRGGEVINAVPNFQPVAADLDKAHRAIEGGSI